MNTKVSRIDIIGLNGNDGLHYNEPIGDLYERWYGLNLMSYKDTEYKIESDIYPEDTNTAEQDKLESGLEMRYFVLKPSGKNPYATASREAMKAYANAIHSVNLKLSFDLLAWVDREIKKT